MRQLRQKDEIIKNLENDITIYKAQLRGKAIPSGIGKLSKVQMDEVMDMIKDNHKTMLNLINSKDFSATNSNINNNNINNTHTNYNNNINNNNNDNTKNNKFKTTGNIRINYNNNGEQIEEEDENNEVSGIIFNLDQLPPSATI